MGHHPELACTCRRSRSSFDSTTASRFGACNGSAIWTVRRSGFFFSTSVRPRQSKHYELTIFRRMIANENRVVKPCVLSFYRSIVQSFYRFIVQSFNRFIVQSFNRFIVLLFYRTIEPSNYRHFFRFVRCSQRLSGLRSTAELQPETRDPKPGDAKSIFPPTARP
jgi:hypothetical protein